MNQATVNSDQAITPPPLTIDSHHGRSVGGGAHKHRPVMAPRDAVQPRSVANQRQPRALATASAASAVAAAPPGVCPAQAVLGHGESQRAQDEVG